MRFLKLFAYVVIAFFLFFCSRHAFANTVISSMRIDEHVTWTLRQSPYVIQGNVTVFPSGSLFIEPGVSVIFDRGSIFARGGRVSVLGTISKPIHVSGQNRGYMFSGDAAKMYFDNVKIQGTRRLLQAWNHSEVYINGLTSEEQRGSGSLITVFRDSVLSASGLYVSGWRGNVLELFNNASSTIHDSVFTNVDKAVNIYNQSTLYGQENAFVENQQAIYTSDSSVSLSENDFDNNEIAVLHNGGDETTVVEASNNWWGNSEPTKVVDIESLSSTDQNAVIGKVFTNPWSAERHRKIDVNCCSNILFLPGLMGSRLYIKDGWFENQLWEPNRNDDVKKLFLNSDGESQTSGIYTRDIINKTNIVGGVDWVEETPYREFSKAMDNLIKDKTISTWQSGPYDWRFAPDTILDEGILYKVGTSTQTKKISDQVVALAKTSKTKKVTIITHSNGGLIAKQLMLALRESGFEYLVDKIIFVGMPEYGTPQAVTSLLFGHEQSIAGGLILRAGVAKDLGKNMPTAYTLLPGTTFFNSITQPMLIGKKKISNVIDMNKIFKDYAHINQTLLDKSSTLHQTLDTWIPSPKTKIYQIVGTGLATVSGIQSIEDDEFIPTYTKTGDGIVQDMFNNQSKTFKRTGIVKAVDLSGTKYKHVNMMNSPTVLQYIDQLFKTGDIDMNADIEVVGNIHDEAFYYEVATVSEPEKTIDKITLKHISPLKPAATYTSESKGSFDRAEEADGGRFESFGNRVLYFTDQILQELEITKNNSGLIDLNIFKQYGGSGSSRLQRIKYENIPIISGSSIQRTGDTVSVQISPALEMNIEPSSITNIDTDGIVISEVLAATSTKSLETKIGEVRDRIKNSQVSDFLKTGYLRRLEVFNKTKDIKYLTGLIERLKRGIVGVDKFRSIPSLKARYTKTREDYVFLMYLFMYIDNPHAAL